ncbi:MAG: geranylgeranyl reductase family protein [Actinobacteria bacterium]|nr:geranylgeranyl reductase family protein [Actinomycetota bacterium]MBV9935263.1 geranylgeranyl reductase family protein [Actinomycetota bacterium]
MAAHDVLVVGGGPAGAACAYWLAEAGHDVLLLEKKHYPREKTCGDGLTPRSVRQLHDIGLAEQLTEFHRFDGLRSLAFGRSLEMKWPVHPDYPSFGYVITRKDLDHLVAERAVKAGAQLWQEAEAVSPVLEGGLLRGAVVKRKDTGTTEEVRARYVVVADGGNSRFGRALGTSRERAYPLGMAIRGYFESPRHDEPWIESHLDIRDKAGNVLPGYGWIFPVGDGRVNVGIGLLSTFHQWKAVNTSQLMDSFVDYAPKSWGISPETSCGAPTGGKLPMALSVTPHAGPTYLVVGDAGGSINPFNGEGIAYAYETGRMAAETLDVALRTGDGHALQDYDRRIHDEYALYFKVARAFVKIIGRPELMRVLVSTGMRSQTLMEWVLRIMSNMLRPDELGPAEAIYKSVAALARVA